MTPSLARLLLAVTLASAAHPGRAAAQRATAAARHDMKMDESRQVPTGWKELDAFHTLIAGTWHPVEKSGNFKPVRMQAADLADAAQALSAAKVPASCDTRPVRAALPALALGARTLANQVVRNASDATVKKALKALHARFETVERRCRTPARK